MGSEEQAMLAAIQQKYQSILTMIGIVSETTGITPLLVNIGDCKMGWKKLPDLDGPVVELKCGTNIDALEVPVYMGRYQDVADLIASLEIVVQQFCPETTWQAALDQARMAARDRRKDQLRKGIVQ